MAKKGAVKKSAEKPVKKAAKKAVVKKKAAVKNKTPFKAHSTSIKEGSKAPYFEGLTQDGTKISMNDLKGKTIVLYFYPKDDTSGCTAQSCNLRDEYKYLTKKDLVVVGVSADNVKSHKKFADKFSLPFPLIADTDKKIINAYDVWGDKMLYGRVYQSIVRTTFIIKDGIVQRIIKDVDTANHAKQVMEN